MGKIEFVGVDGCPSGWFSVGFDSEGCYELKVFPAFSELLDYYSNAKLVLVDIPIGLLNGPGKRNCDEEARDVLKGRKSSVFPVPTRQTVQHVAKSPKDKSKPAYRAANKIERQVAMKGISQQSFGIARKIAQVDRLLRNREANSTPKVREVHPEVCFWALNKRCAMEFNKKQGAGEKQRLQVLERFDRRTREIYHEALTQFRRKCVAKDDILDALVAAVTARLGHDRLKTIPKCPPRDCKGLPMEMVYWRA